MPATGWNPPARRRIRIFPPPRQAAVRPTFRARSSRQIRASPTVGHRGTPVASGRPGRRRRRGCADALGAWLAASAGTPALVVAGTFPAGLSLVLLARWCGHELRGTYRLLRRSSLALAADLAGATGLACCWAIHPVGRCCCSRSWYSPTPSVSSTCGELRGLVRHQGEGTGSTPQHHGRSPEQGCVL